MANSDIDYLEVFDSLPNLLELAKEENPNTQGREIYVFQDRLWFQYKEEGIASLWSMPMDSVAECKVCSQAVPRIHYEIANPKSQSNPKASVTSVHLHSVREHGVKMKAELKKFLAEVAQQRESEM